MRVSSTVVIHRAVCRPTSTSTVSNPVQCVRSEVDQPRDGCLSSGPKTVVGYSYTIIFNPTSLGGGGLPNIIVLLDCYVIDTHTGGGSSVRS